MGLGFRVGMAAAVLSAFVAAFMYQKLRADRLEQRLAAAVGQRDAARGGLHLCNSKLKFISDDRKRDNEIDNLGPDDLLNSAMRWLREAR